LVYIVFEDLPLDEFGNRIPRVTAEIAWAGAPQAIPEDQDEIPQGRWLSNTSGNVVFVKQ
jgi:hypothetical protein